MCLLSDYRYGWTALHYASTEGKLKVAKILVDAGMDINVRDQDGTTATFRAQINGHEEVVKYMCQHGSEDELLNVEEEFDFATDMQAFEEPLYSTVQKLTPNKSVSASEGNLSLKNEPVYAKPNKMKNQTKSVSTPDKTQPNLADSLQFKQTSAQRSKTLPIRGKNIGYTTIRRMLRREFQRAFTVEDDYMNPQQLLNSEETISGDMNIKLGDDKIGSNTMQGLIRDELDKFRRENLKVNNQPVALHTVVPVDERVKQSHGYEDVDLYASIASLPPPPAPPTPSTATIPPLPPRNPPQLLNAMGNKDFNDNSFMSGMTLSTRESSNAALSESFKKLAPQLGSNWKKLAHALPLESNESKLIARIAAIERAHPKSKEKQAAMALGEWRINKGKRAECDDLILALRKADLWDIIPVVEKVTQEFTA